MLGVIIFLMMFYGDLGWAYGDESEDRPTIVISSQQLLSQARAHVYQANLEQAREGYLRLLFFFPTLNLARVELVYTLLLQQQAQPDPGRQEEVNAILSDLFTGLPSELHPYLREITLELEVKLLEQARESIQAQRYTEASQVYQVLLFLIPDWDVAQVGLVVTLASQGKRDQALGLLSEVDLSRLDSRLIETLRALGLGQNQLRFFFAPELYLNSNLARRTQQEMIAIPVFDNRVFELTSGVQDPGIGGTVALGFLFNQPLDPRLTLAVRSGLRLAKFEDRRYDEVEFFSDGRVILRVGDWRGSLGVITSLRRLGDRGQEEGAFGWVVHTPVILESGLSLETRITTLYVQGFRAWQKTTDRRVIQFQQQAYKEIPDLGRAQVMITARFNEWYFQEASDNQEVEFGASFTWESLETLIPTLQGAVKTRRHDQIDPFFLVKRRDEQFRIGIDLCFRQIRLWGRRFCPRYHYTRNVSNIPLYDYQSHEVSLQFQPWIW